MSVIMTNKYLELPQICYNEILLSNTYYNEILLKHQQQHLLKVVIVKLWVSCLH